MKQKLALISGVLAISLLLPFLSPFIFNAEESLGERHREFEEALSVREAVYLTIDNIEFDGYLNTSKNIVSVTKEVYNGETVMDVVYDETVTDYVYDDYHGFGIPYDVFENKNFNNDTQFQFRVKEKDASTDKLIASFSPDFVSPNYSLLLTYKETGPYPGSTEEIKEINGVSVDQLSPQLEYFADIYYAYDDTEPAPNSVGSSKLKTVLDFGLEKMPTLVYKVSDGETTEYIEDFKTDLTYYENNGTINFETEKNDVTFLFVENDEPISRFDHFTKKIYDKYYQEMDEVIVNQLSPVLFDSQEVIDDLLIKESKLPIAKDPLVFSENKTKLSVPGSLLEDELERHVNFDATSYDNYKPSAVADPLGSVLNINVSYQNQDDPSQTEVLTTYENPLTYSVTLDDQIGNLLDEGEKIYLYRKYRYNNNNLKEEYQYVHNYNVGDTEIKASINHPGEYMFVKVNSGDVTPISGRDGFIYEEPETPVDPEDPNEDTDDPTDSEDPDDSVTPVEPDPSDILVINSDNVDTYQVTNGDLYTYNKNQIIIMDEVLRQLQSGNDFKAHHDGLVVTIPKDIVTNQHFYGDQFNYRVTPLTDTSDFKAFRLRSNAYDFRLSNSESLYLSEFPTLSKVTMAFDVDSSRINNPEGLKYATIGRNGDVYIEEISDYMKSTGTVYIEPKQTGKYVIIEEIVEEPNDNTNDEDTDNDNTNDDANNGDTDDDANNDTDDEEDNADDDQDDFDYETNAVVIEDINLSKYQAGNDNLYTDGINIVYVRDDVLDQLTNGETLTTTHDDGKLEVEFPNALLTDDFFENKRFNFVLKEEPNQAGFDDFDLKSQIYRLNIFNGVNPYRAKFPEKVTMTFEVNPNAIDNPEGLRFIRLSEDGGRSINPISSYNETRGEVVIETDTFSFYAIAEVEVLDDVVPNEDETEDDQTDDATDSDDATADDPDNEDGSSNDNDASDNDNTSSDESDGTAGNDSDQTDDSNNDATSNDNDAANTGTNTDGDNSTNTNDSTNTGSVAGASDENETNEESTNNPNSALPDTATLMYSLMAFGLLLIVSSSLLYLISSKKKKQVKN